MAFGVRKGMFFNLIGLGLSGFFVFIFNILAGRALGPEKFGVVSVFYSSLLTFQALLAGGFRDTTVKLVSQYEGTGKNQFIGELTSGIMKTFFCFYFIFILAILLFKNNVTEHIFEGSEVYLLYFAIAVFLFSFFWVLNAVFIGLRKFDISAFNQSIFYFFLPALFLLFYFLKFPQPSGTLIGIVLSPLLSLLIISLLFKKYGFKLTLRGGIDRFLPFLKITLILTVANFLDIFIFRSPPILVKLEAGKGSIYAGFVGAFLSLLNVVRTLSIALYSSLFPNLNRAFEMRDRKLARNYIRNSTLFMIVLTATVFVIFGLYGPGILRFLYGNKYDMGVMETSIFSLFLVFYLMARLFNRILISTGNLNWTMISLMVSFVILVLSFIMVNLNPLLKVGISVASGSLAYFILTGVKVYLIQKFL